MPAKLSSEEFVSQLSTQEHGTDNMLGRLCAYVNWVNNGLCWIRTEGQTVEPMRFKPSQYALIERMMLQSLNSRPIRLVVLKARKAYVTTLIQTLFVFLTTTFRNQIACTLAHIAESTQEIFDISKTAVEYSIMRDSRATENKIVTSSLNSRSWCHTAGSGSVTAGGTPSYLHLSEVALWPQNKKHETLYASLNAVPATHPNTIIVLESTARGREEFFDRFDASFNRILPWSGLFIPWYWRDDLRSRCRQLERTNYETLLVREAGANGWALTDEHLQWRREKLEELGEFAFRQEFPSTPEEAVQAASGLVVPGLRSCIVDDVPFDPFMLERSQRIGGMDCGYNDPTVILTAVNWDSVIYVINLYRKTLGLAADHIEGLWHGHHYWHDPSATGPAAEIASEARKTLLPITISAAPRQKAERQLVYTENEWHHLRTLIVQGRLKILRDCAPQIILEGDNLFYNEKTNQPNQVRSDACGHFDTLDALRYLCMGVKAVAPLGIKRTSRRESRKEALRRF